MNGISFVKRIHCELVEANEKRIYVAMTLIKGINKASDLLRALNNLSIPNHPDVQTNQETRRD